LNVDRGRAAGGRNSTPMYTVLLDSDSGQPAQLHGYAITLHDTQHLARG